MKVNQFDPYFTQDEAASILDTIKWNWITEGKKTAEFETLLKKRTGAKYVIMVPNGTLALYIALKVLGIKEGDEVIVPNFTFVGSATSVALTGARPVFADVNLDDFNLDIESLSKCVTRRTAAIMPVHLYGQAAQMDQVMKIARKHHLYVVEDAAQGLGVTFGSKHVGTFGDLGCISFYADKTITTGEGGAILTNNKKLADRCQYFKNQGRLKRGSFLHPYLGYNFRITDLQAAIGVAQMKKLDWIIRKKLEIENLYKKLLKNVKGVRFPVITHVGKRVPFRINLLVEEPARLADYLTKKEVGVRRFFYPLHRQPCFNSKNSVKLRHYPNSIKIFESGISMPSGVSLTDQQIRYVCGCIREFYARS